MTNEIKTKILAHMEHVIKAARKFELVHERNIISYAQFGALHANQFTTFMKFFFFCIFDILSISIKMKLPQGI